MTLGDTVRIARAAWSVLRRDGLGVLVARLVRVLYRRSGAAAFDFPLQPADIADSTTLPRPNPVPGRVLDRPLSIGWVMTPPDPGSGGHTTVFRMIEALEAAGHTCTIHLYDRLGGDVRQRAQIIRAGWPGVRAELHDAADGLAGRDAWVATGWPTAHVLGTRMVDAVPRLYLVQDYEPFFYAQGSEYALAEDTYRFGFRCITVGRMLADLLAAELGVVADAVEFGCDTDVYRLTNPGPRSGVVFYVKPDVPRRGYRLGLAALSQFHRLHPDQPIHLFGDPPSGVDFPAVRHGRLRPDALNSLYNETVAGLALSFTNISLVPEEMLAAGTIPVVNESPYARGVLTADAVRWARPTPAALAHALGEVVGHTDVPGRARSAAAVVAGGGWLQAQRQFVALVEAEVRGTIGQRVP